MVRAGVKSPFGIRTPESASWLLKLIEPSDLSNEMKKNKRGLSKYTYYAFYKDKSVKLGYTKDVVGRVCLLHTSPSQRDRTRPRMPTSAQKKKKMSDERNHQDISKEYNSAKTKGSKDEC